MAVASILVARLLGPENYGLHAVAMIPLPLIALSDLGISRAYARSTRNLEKKILSLGVLVGISVLILSVRMILKFAGLM